MALRYNCVDHPSTPILFNAHFHCKTLRDRVMRGLGYGSHIERSAVSSRLTYLPPCSLTSVRRVPFQTPERGVGAPRFLASGWFMIGIRVNRVMFKLAHDAGTRYKLVCAASRRVGRMRSRQLLAPTFTNDLYMLDGCHKDRMVVRV